MEVTANLRPREGRWSYSLLLSLLWHALALWLIGTGRVGLPTGVPPSQLYALSYLGALAAATEASEASPQRQPAPATRVERQPAAQPARAPRLTAPPTPVRPAPKATGQLLTAERGQETVPLPPKPKEESPREPSPAPVAASQASPAPPLSPSGEPSAGPAGGGEGAPAPPRGTTLVAALPRLVYPKAAQNASLRGTVRLRVLIGPDGRPVRAEVEQRSGEPILDEYARRAVERGLTAQAWVSPYVIRVEARFTGGAPEVRVLDEPVEVLGG